jgi:putative ABC transport system permease protein
MNVLDVARFAAHGLTANKLRSALTILGVLIGVGAVILLVAVGNGSQKAIEAQIEGLGTNVLTVSAGGPGARFGGGGGPSTQTRQLSLTMDDVTALRDKDLVPDVKSVSPVVNGSVTATYQGTSYDIQQTVGTTPEYLETLARTVASGSAFTSQDVENARKVVLLGATTSEELFGGADPVGQSVNLSGVPFQVIGVLESKGASGAQSQYDLAIAPITAVQQSLTGYGDLSQVVIQAASAAAIDPAEAEVLAVLNQRHDVTDSSQGSFTVLNQESLLETRTQATQTFTVLLAAVAAISLLVGGIGITNIMLVTVTERTREIGIRKAIGAPRGAILGQFLIEATLLSLVGGGLGVAAGVLGSQFTVAGVDPVVSPSSILLAFGVSALIGLFFGSFPANQAAKLRPIDALRHE